MTTAKRDPLLTVGRILIGLSVGVLCLGSLALLCLSPLMLLFQDQPLAKLAAEGTKVGPNFMHGLSILVASLGAMLAAGAWFFLLLFRIVGSVEEGDPFIPVNADRLSTMGWIGVGVQLLSLPIGALVLSLAEAIKDADGIRVAGEFGIDGGGILLTLVLFILARVFRQGAAMRADLEGTV